MTSLHVVAVCIPGRAAAATTRGPDLLVLRGRHIPTVYILKKIDKSRNQMDNHINASEGKMEGRWIEEEMARLELPVGSHAGLWKSFARELFLKIEEWEEGERRAHQASRWDFSIIHSVSPHDVQTARHLKTLLETSLGLTGRTLGDIEPGERTLSAAERMVDGSTKVFILATQYFNRPGFPKFVFQDALMEEILQEKWRRKIIPVIVPGCLNSLLFGLRGIRGITLGDDPRTVELVSNSISVEEQMEVRSALRRSKARLEEKLRLLRAEKVQQVRQVVARMRHEFGDHYDPTQELQQMIEYLRHVDVPDQLVSADQVINVSGCTNISVGPSIHFTLAGNSIPPLTPPLSPPPSTPPTTSSTPTTLHSATPPAGSSTPTTLHSATPPTGSSTPTTLHSASTDDTFLHASSSHYDPTSYCTKL